MKTLLAVFFAAVALTLAAEVSFWKDGTPPNMSIVAVTTTSTALQTAFESRPYSEAVVDNVPIQTTVKGMCLSFR